MSAGNTGAKTVIVLGGGVGGLVAANRLRGSLPSKHRVVLVDREPRHLFQPSLLWVAVGDREPERIQRPLDRLRRKRIDVVTAGVSEIDPTTRTVRAGGDDSWAMR
jgi:sulfide:quinone oxidoreductase